MKKLLLFIAMSMSVCFVEAQTELWTVDKCMSYALEHSTAVQKKMFEASNSTVDYHAAVASFFPQVGAQVNAQFNWGRNIDPETNTYNTVTTFNNYYQLYASVYLFDGGQVINQFKQARVGREQGLNNIQKAKDEKAIEVMQNFIDAVYNEACARLAADKLNDSRHLLLMTSRQEQLGIKGKPDVAQIKAQVAEDDYNLTHQQNQYRTALLTLRSSMNFPTVDSLSVDTLLPHFIPSFRVENVDEIYRYASTSHPDVRAAELNVMSSRYLYHIQKGKLLPSLSLTAGVATNYYRNMSNGDATLPFSTQFKNNRGEYIGATLSMPIFDPTLCKNARKARNNVQIAILERDEARRKIHTDIEQAVMDRNAYVKEIVQMEDKVAADVIACHVAHRKYEEGMCSVFDLQTAANTLLKSRVSLLQMRMMYVLKDRLVDYYKGLSLIKDNK